MLQQKTLPASRLAKATVEFNTFLDIFYELYKGVQHIWHWQTEAAWLENFALTELLGCDGKLASEL